MQTALILMAIQGLIGAFDNLWHHEITQKLSSRPEARNELILHTIREFLYAVIFLGIAWFAWNGAWATLLLLIMAIEVVVTLWDFVIEDQTRKLPKLERIVHTVLAINFGAILAFFLPVALAWREAETGLAAVDYGVLSWIMTAYGIGVLGWALYDLWVVARLSLPEWKRRPILPGHKQAPLQVLVTGATGFIGTALVRALIERGDRPLVLARNAAKAGYLFGPHVEVLEDLDEIDSQRRIDAVINLAGEPLLGGLWTRHRRQRLIASRTETTRGVVALLRRLRQKPEVLISGSAIGYYGRRGDEVVRENGLPQEVFTSQLCLEWEAEARRADELGIRTCLPRIGLVFGRGGGAFPQLALPVRLGLGMIMGAGRQWMSWIHLQDLVNLIVFTLDRDDIAGPVNATAPRPVTNAVFTRSLARNLKRPLLLRMPAVVLRRLLGELADLFVAGQKVVPQKAEGLGFLFHYPDLDSALPDLLNRPETAKPREEANEDLCWVFYDDGCAICAGEIGLYRKEAERKGLAMTFQGISADSKALRAYGLSHRDVLRRLYVFDAQGRLVSGIDAMAAIWSAIPKYRWAARLVRLPLIHGAAEVLYDAVVVPLLAIWNRRRDAHRKVRTKGRKAHG